MDDFNRFLYIVWEGVSTYKVSCIAHIRFTCKEYNNIM